MKKKWKIGIVGATGLVGTELREAMSRRQFPVSKLKLYSSWNSAGEKVAWEDDELVVEMIPANFYQELDLVFFCTPPHVSRDLAPSAGEAGVKVIDCSSAFRQDESVPLVVPEVNPQLLSPEKIAKNIIASPSPASIAISLIAAPLHQKWKLTRIIATAIFGSTARGRAGLEEHQAQSIAIFNQGEIVVEHFPRQSAFNIFPCVGEVREAETTAEQEVREEVPRLLGESLPVFITAMQAPVFCGLALSLYFDFARELSVAEAREELGRAVGIKIMDDLEQGLYPDTLEAMAEDQPLVGRIRQRAGDSRSLQLWVSADNLRKGSALNMLQIAERLLQDQK